MTRLGAVSRLVRTPVAHTARFAAARRATWPRNHPESEECRLIRVDAAHRVSRQPAGLADRRLEEGRLVVGNRCPSKNQNIPDESTILPP